MVLSQQNRPPGEVPGDPGIGTTTEATSGIAITDSYDSAADRVLVVLEWFARAPTGRRSLRQIAAETGLTKSTVHRVTGVLVRRGWLRQDGAETFMLASQAVRLGTVALSGLDGMEVLRRSAAELRDQTGETAFITALDGRDLVILDKYESPSPIRLHGQVGSRSPAHANAAGKALLALLPEEALDAYLATPLETLTAATIRDPDALREELVLIRSRGFAVTDGEAVEGAASIGAAVLDARGQPFAGLSVAGPRDRVRCADTRATDLVVAAALRASASMGAPFRAWLGELNPNGGPPPARSAS